LATEEVGGATTEYRCKRF